MPKALGDLRFPRFGQGFRDRVSEMNDFVQHSDGIVRRVKAMICGIQPQALDVGGVEIYMSLQAPGEKRRLSSSGRCP